MSRQTLLIVGLIAALLFFLVGHFGMIQFGGMDGSAAIQAGWRYYLGQKPYVDFETPAPPCYLVIPGVAFHLFGVNWSALVLPAAIFCAGTFLLHIALLRRLFWNWTSSLSLALTTQAITILPVSWWSYNQTTSVAAVLFVTACAVLVRNPADRLNQSAVILTMIILSWMKANVAGLALIGATGVLLLNPRTRTAYLLSAVLAVLGSVGLLILSGINPIDMVTAYLSSGGRLGSKAMLMRCFWINDHNEAVVTLALLIPSLAGLILWSATRLRRSENPPGYWTILALAAVAILCGVAGMCTNNDHNMVDAAGILSGAALAIFHPVLPQNGEVAKAGRRLPDILVLTSVILLGLLGSLVTYNRARIWSIGPGAFYQDTPLQTIEEPRFFEGLETGPRLATLLIETNNLLVTAPDLPRDSVFFGPRIEFGYAAFGFIPKKGLFLWWPGTGEAPESKIEEVTRRFAEWNPKLCIFLRNDFTFMPPALLKHLSEHYDIYHSKTLTILKQRQP